MRPSGCRILPHGAPLHPENIFTSFGVVWDDEHSRRRQYKTVRSSRNEISYAAGRGRRVLMPNAHARPRAGPKHHKGKMASFVVFGSHMEAFGVIWRRAVFSYGTYDFF